MQSMMIASQQQLMRRASSSVASGTPPQSSSPPINDSPTPSSENGHTPPPYHATSSTTTDANMPARSESRDSVSSQATRTPRRRTKRQSSWMKILNPSYKSRSDDFKKIFADAIPSNERLVVDYSCALQKEILIHGRVYVSLNFFCFYANIFKWETSVIIKCSEIKALTKTNTARVIPNAIQIEMVSGEKYVLTSFAARDKTYVMLFRIWQHALMGQQMSNAEVWSWVHYSYGENLGCSSEEEEELRDNNDNAQSALTTTGNSQMEPLSPELLVKANASDNSSEEFGGSYVRLESENQTGTELRPMGKSIQAIEENEQEDQVDLGPDKQRTNRSPLKPSKADLSSVPANFQAPVNCDCVHSGKELVKQTFHVSPDVLFSLLFTDSLFYRKLIDDRKTYDLVVYPWDTSNQLVDGIDACPAKAKTRRCTYTVPINHALAKDAKTTEDQYLLVSKPGSIYVIKCEAVNHGIPYCDYFSVRSHWCITRGSNDSQTQLRVHAQVYFKKSGWSVNLVKPLIEKNAFQGISDYVSDCVAALTRYGQGDGSYENEDEVSIKRIKALLRSNSLGRGCSLDIAEPDDIDDDDVGNSSGDEEAAGPLNQSMNSKRSARSRSGTLARSRSATINSYRHNVQEQERTGRSGAARDDSWMLKIILAVLFLLFVSNIFLYTQLYKLESAGADLDDLFLAGEINNGDPNIPKAESIKWKQVLARAIKLINLMEKNLAAIKENIKDEL